MLLRTRCHTLYIPYPLADSKPFTKFYERKGGRRRKGRRGKKDSAPGKGSIHLSGTFSRLLKGVLPLSLLGIHKSCNSIFHPLLFINKISEFVNCMNISPYTTFIVFSMSKTKGLSSSKILV